MIRRASTMRVTRVQLAVVAAVSVMATALILIAATGRTAAQSAALAALRHRQGSCRGEAAIPPAPHRPPPPIRS